TLVSSELSYQTWGILNGSWNPREFLPFQLCSIAGILTMLALLTKNKKIIQVILFIGIVPSFLAVVTPELHHGFPHFRFWQFFIHHFILSWACIFLVLTSKIKITFKKTIEFYLYLLCYAAIIRFFINPIFDANFLFLARTPSTSTPLNFLGDGFW
ncbi:TMEM164-related integral membrane acyltransferase, partial [Clavibacter michiganensis]|uniref:TMEM164-related integral membrane acyltransferase n=1 Tax=Clavibacter michiganensis TaxID=28447 RepID=UPI002930A4FC